MRSFDRDFSKHTNRVIGVAIFSIILKLVIIGGITYLAILAVSYIGEHGLKGIMEQIWEGVPK